MGEAHRWVYGPVRSRRFGISLGVDPVVRKTCCYDCVYCQQGPTTDLTVRRTHEPPAADVIADVRRTLARGPAPDVLTLAGSGEPTLHAGLAEIVSGLRDLFDGDIVLLTNGALLSDPAVLDVASEVDVVCPSLDAGDERTFRAINRPHEDLEFGSMVEGLHDLRESARGRYLLEVFLARGVNDTPDRVERLAAQARAIEPDAILLNTAVRPVPGRDDLCVEHDRMTRLAGLFGPRCEIIARPSASRSGARVDAREEILATLERRPSNTDDLAASLGLARETVASVLEDLERDGRVARAAGDYWRAT